MADTSFINKYRYFHQPHGYIDERFVRDVLLPGLNKQSKYSSIAQGIQLDNEDPPEYLPLDQAAILALDWLSQAGYLDEETTRQLESLIRPGSYIQLAKILTAKFNNIKEQEKIAVATNEDRLESYRQHLSQSGEPAGSYRFSSADTIARYHSAREEVITLLRRGYTPDQLKQLSFQNPAIDRILFATLADNLSRLYSASYQFGDTNEDRSQAVAKELFQIIRDEHPELTDLLPVLRDPAWSHVLTRQIDRVVQSTSTETLKQLELDKHHAYQAQADLLPTRSELRQEIVSALTNNFDKSQELADAILKDIVASYGNQISATEVVRLAAKRVGEDPQSLVSVVKLLQDQGLDVAIEYRQREMHVLYQGVRLSRSEKKLLTQGISFLHSTNQQTAITSAILAELKLEKSANLSDALNQEYAREKANHPASPRLKKLRQLQEHYYHSTQLTDDQLKLLKNSRFGRLDIGTKINVVSNKIYDFYDTATGGKLIRKFYDWYDKTAETKAILKIPLRNGKKLEIPLLRLSTWAFDQWDLLKKRATLRLYRFASSSKFPRWARRPVRWLARQYRLGGYEVNGAIFQFTHRQIGRATAWALAKTGLSSVFKYAAKPSAGLAVRYTANVAARATVRLFIKIGGKALGKFAAKGITALLAAGTVIGNIFFAVFIASMIWDVLKLGFTFIKEFIHNADFRGKVQQLGLMISGVMFAIPAAIGTALAFIAALFNPLAAMLVISVFASLGLVAFTSMAYNLSVQTIPGLDIKYEPPASSANFGAASGCKDQTIPTPTGAGIPTRASEIVADLHGGFWGYCNRPTNPDKSKHYFGIADLIKNESVYSLSNRPNLFDYELFTTSPNPTREEIQTSGNALYWCTYLVQHSYRESGQSGFSSSLWSPTLEDEFRKSHIFVEGSAANSSNIKPGDIVFFKTLDGPDRTNHVGVVNTVNSHGFEYYQSNAPDISGSGTFGGGGASVESGIMVVGFGRLK